MHSIAIHPPCSALCNATIFFMEKWQDRARHIMRDKKLSQRAVAERMNRSQSTFACWLSGRNVPNLEDMDQLASALGVDTPWLVYGIEYREDPIVGRIVDVIKDLPAEESEKLAEVFEAIKGVSH